MPRAAVLSLLFSLVAVSGLRAEDPVSKELLKQTFDAVGGETKLLKLFRIKEKLILGADPKGKGSERTSVLEPPNYWWMGKKERVKDEKEPAIFLVWGWTLGALADPKSELSALPEMKIDDRPAYGIQIKGTINPPMQAWFDKESKQLVRLDWRKDTHRFSDWKEVDGVKYPARCTGFRPNGAAWYHTEIIEIERLKELPTGLMR